MMTTQTIGQTGRQPHITSDGRYLEKRMLYYAPSQWQLMYAMSRESGMPLSHYLLRLVQRDQIDRVQEYRDRIDLMDSRY
jgi:hypothetical protein